MQNPVPLLYQTGYLTIVDYDKEGNQTSKVIRTYPITTEREWKVIEATIEALQK